MKRKPKVIPQAARALLRELFGCRLCGAPLEMGKEFWHCSRSCHGPAIPLAEFTRRVAEIIKDAGLTVTYRTRKRHVLAGEVIARHNAGIFAGLGGEESR